MKLQRFLALGVVLFGIAGYIASEASSSSSDSEMLQAIDDLPQAESEPIAGSTDSSDPDSADSDSDLAVGSVKTVSASAATELDDADQVSESSSSARLRSARMTFTGDVLIHDRVREMASQLAGPEDEDGFDFRPMFAPIEPLISAADWSVCHLEVPLSSTNTGLSGYPAFRGPGALAFDLAEVGFDSCSTASNHSLDAGTEGVIDTIDTLEKAGLRSTGTARSEAERETSIWLVVNDISIAHLSYSFGFNGYVRPSDKPWLANLIEPDLILADAARARAEGAEVVIVSLHWGDEYQHQPNGQQAELGPMFAESEDIDLIIGHHAHVIQPVGRQDGDWIVYGLGNLLHNQREPHRKDELMAIVDLNETAPGRFDIDLSIVALYIDSTQYTIYPASPTSRPTELSSGLEGELNASFDRTFTILEDSRNRYGYRIDGAESRT